MSFLNTLLIGIVIGSAAIIPGLSGGVLAVIFGVYDKVLYAFSNLFKDFKKNFIYILTIGTGVLLGIVWFSRVMMFLYQKHEAITKFAFIGLIIGGIPYLFKQIRNKVGVKANYKVITITLITSFILWVISTYNPITIVGTNNPILFFISGMVYVSGKIIPGLSSSVLLIMMGMYEYILSFLSNPIAMLQSNIGMMIPFIIGVIFGIILFIKVMSYMLSNYFRTTYSIIIELVMISILAIIPKVSDIITLLVGIILLIFSSVLSYKLLK